MINHWRNLKNTTRNLQVGKNGPNFLGFLLCTLHFFVILCLNQEIVCWSSVAVTLKEPHGKATRKGRFYQQASNSYRRASCPSSLNSMQGKKKKVNISLRSKWMQGPWRRANRPWPIALRTKWYIGRQGCSVLKEQSTRKKSKSICPLGTVTGACCTRAEYAQYPLPGTALFLNKH